MDKENFYQDFFRTWKVYGSSSKSSTFTCVGDLQKNLKAVSANQTNLRLVLSILFQISKTPDSVEPPLENIWIECKKHLQESLKLEAHWRVKW